MITLRFAHGAVKTTASATLMRVSDTHQTWIPNQFKLDVDLFAVPDDFRFKVEHEVLRSSSSFIGIELPQEYDAVLLADDEDGLA